jgi:hypothetical protein
MDADATRNPAIAAMTRGSWLVLGGITLAAMALAMLALDDITTDNAAQFPAESVAKTTPGVVSGARQRTGFSTSKA